MNDVERVHEGELGRIFVCLGGSRVHLGTNPEMREQQTIEVLPDQIRQPAPQNQPPFRQTVFDFRQAGFDRPAVRIQKRQLFGWRF